MRLILHASGSLRDIGRRCAGKTVLVVTHGGPLYRMLQWIGPDGMDGSVGNGAISEVCTVRAQYQSVCVQARGKVATVPWNGSASDAPYSSNVARRCTARAASGRCKAGTNRTRNQDGVRSHARLLNDKTLRVVFRGA